MLVNTIKFIHLLFVMGLLSGVTYCIYLVFSKNSKDMATLEFKLLYTNRILLWVCLIALCTGTLLVYPKNFTFHTQWIQAAYLLVIVFCTGILISKRILRKMYFSYFSRFILGFIYLLLTLILIFLVHDAVAKSTFLLLPQF